MNKVLKSYAPFLLWLLVATYALIPARAWALDDSLDVKLAAARQLVAKGDWNEAARIRLPADGAAAWREHRRAECELLFLRGVGAARAGYAAMAWHSVERLEALRDRYLAEGQAAHAADVEALRNRMLAEPYLNR